MILVSLGLELLGLGFLGLGSAARADGPEVWAALYSGRLSESADRDPAASIAIYETLIEHTSEDDPIRGELFYWLGRARYGAGEIELAREALRHAARDPRSHVVARELQGRIEMEAGRVTSLPYREDFHGGRGSWVRGWPRGFDEDLGTEPSPGDGGDPCLTWLTEVAEGESDTILLPVTSGGRGLQRLRLELRSERFEARLRVMLEDSRGELWSAPVLEVGTEAWLTVDLPLTAFAPASAPAERRHPEGGTIRSLQVRDVTAFHTTSRGENRLYLDDVELR